MIMTKIRKFFTPIMSFFKIEQEISFKKIFLASLLGICIHILLDSPLYTDIRPFFPLDFNPFYSTANLTGLLYAICVWCFLIGLIVYIIRLSIYAIKNRIKNHNSHQNNNCLL